jgi:predicted GH43/DUF377 family glycosyl hydrolase
MLKQKWLLAKKHHMTNRKMKDLVYRKMKMGSETFEVDLNNPFSRYAHNPVVNEQMVNKVWKPPHQQVTTVHNAGIAEYKGEVIMLFRSHLRNGISVLGIARSRNGLTNWEIDQQPAMTPCSQHSSFAEGVEVQALIENEEGGVEDPRITKIDDTYFITYSAYHGLIKDRVRVSLATTKDFKDFKRHGGLLDVDMRNVVIFPDKINGKYVGLFRPNDTTEGDVGGIFKQIRIGYCNDLYTNKWSIDDEPIIKQEGGPSAFKDKIGPGAPVMKTKYGWINIFHGVRNTMDGNPYVLGVALHELSDPKKVTVSNIPVLYPSKADCRVTDDSYVHVPNVVFTCGAWRREDGVILMYYGGNDTVMNVAVSHEDVLAELCIRYPQDALTGKPNYSLRDETFLTN